MTGPDAAGAHNAFIVEPTGFYAMMSIHAPAARGKLESKITELEVDWASWIGRLIDVDDVMFVSCHSKIACWVARDGAFNPFAHHMLALLAVKPPSTSGTAVFTGGGFAPGDTVIPCGLTGDQFGTLAAAYRTAARKVVPVMYGKEVEVNG